MRLRGLDAPATAGGAAGLAAATWTVVIGVVPTSAAVPALLVPGLFLVGGLLGPVWSADRFTCRLLVAIGGLHLLAIAASATARLGAESSAWHALSLLLFTAGFGLMLPLAAGYPAGPAPRWSWATAAAACGLPLAAALSAPTPAVLQGGSEQTLFRPIVALLPPEVAAASIRVFLLPVAGVVIAVARAVRDGRTMRGRLALPLGALGAFAVLLALGSVLPAASTGVATALFLVGVPLVPAGLVLGARPATAVPTRPPPSVDERALRLLTPREREVLGAMADGESNGAIARRLHISVSAVEKHTTAIFTKLELPHDTGTHRRVAAVVAYLRASR